MVEISHWAATDRQRWVLLTHASTVVLYTCVRQYMLVMVISASHKGVATLYGRHAVLYCTLRAVLRHCVARKRSSVH
jgi:hypothetical protein